MNAKAMVFIAMSFCGVAGLGIGRWIPQPLPKDIVGYYVRHPDGYCYVQVDRTSPMLRAISTDEWHLNRERVIETLFTKPHEMDGCIYRTGQKECTIVLRSKGTAKFFAQMFFTPIAELPDSVLKDVRLHVMLPGPGLPPEMPRDRVAPGGGPMVPGGSPMKPKILSDARGASPGASIILTPPPGIPPPIPQRHE